MDGTVSEKFVTVSKGMKMLTALVHAGKISKNVEEGYRQAITIAGFVLKDTELDEIFEVMLREKEEWRKSCIKVRVCDTEPDIVTPFEEKAASAPAKRIVH